MRIILMLIALLIAGPVLAAEVTSEKALLDYAQIIKNYRAHQANVCTPARSKSVAQCNRDFEEFFPLTVDVSLAHTAYLRAKEKGEGGTDILRRKYEFAKAVAVQKVELLDAKYVYATQSSTQPPIRAGN